MPSLIYIALPVMNELDYLPMVIEAIMEQTVQQFRLVICVNQPESWWDEPAHFKVCNANQQTIHYLESLNDSRIEILDRASPGRGWPPKGQGIGFARKFVMDHISAMANEKDIIISMDADTVFDRKYFASVIENLTINPTASAIAVPYYHGLDGDPVIDRAVLRYEIYMRAYAINMWRINSPYCFTALGSAIVVPVWAYRAVGGMTPKLSGEDFYFLQKIVKTGRLIHWNIENVYPAPRLSDRVNFGTGPALIKGVKGNWDSYPVYPFQLFDQIAETYKAFAQLYKKDIATPLDDFLFSRFGELPWEKLRKNFNTQAHFVRACHEKIDGLRILQFLKEKQPSDETASAAATIELVMLYKEQWPELVSEINGNIDFTNSPIDDLNKLRDLLYEIELHYRRLHWHDFAGLTALCN